MPAGDMTSVYATLAAGWSTNLYRYISPAMWGQPSIYFPIGDHVGRVRRVSEKAGLYLNVGKTKVMTTGDIGEVTRI